MQEGIDYDSLGIPEKDLRQGEEISNEVGKLFDGVEMKVIMIVLVNMVHNYFGQLQIQKEEAKNEEQAEQIQEAISTSAEVFNHILFRAFFDTEEEFELILKEIQDRVAKATGHKGTTTH